MYREGLILKDLHDLAQRSRLSFYQISVSAVDTRNAALLRLAELLEQEKAAVFSANQKDLENANGGSSDNGYIYIEGGSTSGYGDGTLW